jgi:hypothetical protein
VDATTSAKRSKAKVEGEDSLYTQENVEEDAKAFAAATAAGESVATTLSSNTKKSLQRAQDIAKRHLDALEAASPKKSGKKTPDYLPAPTTDMVFEVLAAIGTPAEWPTQTRPNVTVSGGPVPGMCLGLVFALGGGGSKASLVSESFPLLANFVVRWCRATLPKTKGGNEFPFSSLQVNFNYAACKHVDGNNLGPSYIQSIGPHTGGALWTADQGVINCKVITQTSQRPAQNAAPFPWW